MKAEKIYKNGSTYYHSEKNRTGLPDNLKAGIENLSGYSMDDVRVHYGSASRCCSSLQFIRKERTFM